MNELTDHCNALEIAGNGILIFGSSGAGKSSLTLGLLERARQAGMSSGFVSDDRTILETRGHRLIARAPENLNGKIELRGYGIVKHPSIPHTEITAAVRMLPDEFIDRMPEPASIEIKGITIPQLSVPQRHETAAVRIVFAWLQDNTDRSISLAL